MGSKSPHGRENGLFMGLGRPVSRILLYPAIHLRGRDGAYSVSTPGPLGAPRLPCPDLRTNLACSHRWFTWPVPRGIPPVGSYPTLSPITCAVYIRDMSRMYRPSAGLLSVALDVAAGLSRAAPRVVGPSGLLDLGRGAPWCVFTSGPRESGLCSASWAKPRDTATGRTAQTLVGLYLRMLCAVFQAMYPRARRRV